uniref:Uncharacterized protein n=1 Tax=Rhipicephalus zambeziensis TaxID=60191 RepID=A0A224YHZ9_9ACAR
MMINKYFALHLLFLLSLIVLVMSARRNTRDHDDDDEDDDDGKAGSRHRGRHDTGEDDSDNGDGNNDSDRRNKSKKKRKYKSNNEDEGNDGSYNEICDKLQCQRRNKTCCLLTSGNCDCQCVRPAISCRIALARPGCRFLNIEKCVSKGGYEQCRCAERTVVRNQPNPETVKRVLSTIAQIIPNVPGIPNSVRSRIPVNLINKVIPE